MPEAADSRVAVYIDFDNIIISRYSQVHPTHRREQLSKFTPDNTEMKARLDAATVDIGAILDYASSFGTIVISRAYADWSLPVNSSYQRQLISRAVDLTQMFPTSATKNGADIRLAVDVVEDLFRLPTITHVVIVAGDSDYISLAQRAKRLDRYVVGIGVAGSVSSSLAVACDEFANYDDLPGVEKPVIAPIPAEAVVETVETVAAPAVKQAQKKALKTPPVAKEPAPAATSARIPAQLQSQRDKAAMALHRALTLGVADDDGWQHSSAVKNQMKRLDPTFSEKAIEFGSFMDFVESRPKLVEVKKDGQSRMLRLR